VSAKPKHHRRTPEQKAAAIAAMTTSAEAILGRKLVLGRKLGAKVPVSLRAVLQRINRKLRDDGEAIRAARSERARSDFGDYYVVSDRSGVWPTHVDPEALAREIGVLQPWEEMR
jgi:hypothetical protein